jgi:hypothetical protein
MSGQLSDLATLSWENGPRYPLDGRLSEHQILSGSGSEDTVPVLAGNERNVDDSEMAGNVRVMFHVQ